MINGIQFIIHMPAINIAMPANAMLISTSLIKIATFEVPYFKMETIQVYYVDEDEVLGDRPPNLVSSFD
jgi:hypothetical protein